MPNRTLELAVRRGAALKKLMEDKKTSLSAVSKLLQSDADAQRKLLDRLRSYTKPKKPRLIPSSLAINIAHALGVNASDVYLELTEKEQVSLGANAAHAATLPIPGSLEDRRKSHAKVRKARGKKLRSALEKSGLKQKQLLEKIVASGGPQYNPTTVGGYLAGRSLASDDFVMNVAKVLEVDAATLLAGNSTLAVSRASPKKKLSPASVAINGITIAVSAPSIGLSADDTVTIRKGALVGNQSEIISDGKDGYVLSIRVPVPASALPTLLKMFMPGS